MPEGKTLWVRKLTYEEEVKENCIIIHFEVRNVA